MFPLARRSKRPLTETGFQEATTDIATVEAWWKGNPEANIGFPPGKAGFVVFDIDGPAGEKTAEALGLLSEPTLECVSNRGRHLYFRRPACLPYVGNLKLAPDLDVRCDAGYVVISPSVHPDGPRYRWKGKLEDIKALPPKALEALVAQATAPRSDIAERIERQEAWPEGERHTRLVQAAGRLISKGHGPEEVLALVDGLNATNCVPPLVEGEVAKIVADIQDTDRKRHPDRYQREVSESSEQRGVSSQESLSSRSDIAGSGGRWPDPLAAAALCGLLGDFVTALDPYTEADPVALLGQGLVALGNAIGRGPYFAVEGSAYHYTNEFVVLVGATGKGRKGTSLQHVKSFLTPADLSWGVCIKSGLSSGEGLIYHIRDGDGDPEGKDLGVSDKRLLVIESEYASVLRKIAREGNVLSPVMRDAWDGETLATLTKNNSVCATRPHVSLIGHITDAELRRHLDRTEIANGFLNRHLLLAVRRSKYLPDGRAVPDELRHEFVARFREVLEFTSKVERMRRSPEAGDLWRAEYRRLSDGRPGLLGAATSRAEAHVLRLSMLYALAARSKVIHCEHLEAALAVWAHAEATAGYVFGDAIGDPVADTVLQAIRKTPDGLNRTAIYALFNRHESRSAIERALTLLESQGHIDYKQEKTGGRPRQVYRATQGSAESDGSEETETAA